MERNTEVVVSWATASPEKAALAARKKTAAEQNKVERERIAAERDADLREQVLAIRADVNGWNSRRAGRLMVQVVELIAPKAKKEHTDPLLAAEWIFLAWQRRATIDDIRDLWSHACAVVEDELRKEANADHGMTSRNAMRRMAMPTSEARTLWVGDADEQLNALVQEVNIADETADAQYSTTTARTAFDYLSALYADDVAVTAVDALLDYRNAHDEWRKAANAARLDTNMVTNLGIDTKVWAAVLRLVLGAPDGTAGALELELASMAAGDNFEISGLAALQCRRLDKAVAAHRLDKYALTA